MKNIKLILFDFGGVLVDYSKSFQTASKEQGIPIEYLDNAFDNNEEDITKGIIEPQDIFNMAVKESGVGADIKYDFVNSWVRDYKVIQPTWDLLAELSKTYQVGILSNVYKGMIVESIKLGRLPDINYSYIFESCEIGNRKPEKEIYEYVEKETGFSSKEILFIDDRQDFIEGAQRIGWITYLFDSTNPVVSVPQILDILNPPCCQSLNN